MVTTQPAVLRYHQGYSQSRNASSQFSRLSGAFCPRSSRPSARASPSTTALSASRQTQRGRVEKTQNSVSITVREDQVW